MFINRKMWELIQDDIRDLQHDVYYLELIHNKKEYEEIMLDDYETRHSQAMHRHPSSSKKTTTKKVEKNGK